MCLNGTGICVGETIKEKNRAIHFFKYCRSGNIREVLIFANFEKKTNSQIKKSRENLDNHFGQPCQK